MGNKYAQSNGAWSAGGPGGIWFDAASGGNNVAKPAAGDNAYINTGVTVALDESPTCDLIEGVGTGKMTISGDLTINANMQAGTGVLLTYTGAWAVTVNGNVTGGSGSSAFGIYANNNTAGSNVIVNGTVTGGSGATSYGVYAKRDSTITAAKGGSGFFAAGAYCEGNVHNIGTAEGGSGNGAHGVLASSTTIVVGTAKGGSVVTASGVGFGWAYVEVGATDLTGAGQPVGVRGVKLADGVLLRFEDAAGNPKRFYGADLIPAEADVKNGVGYGGGDFEGSLEYPTPEEIAAAMWSDEYSPNRRLTA